MQEVPVDCVMLYVMTSLRLWEGRAAYALIKRPYHGFLWCAAMGSGFRSGRLRMGDDCTSLWPADSCLSLCFIPGKSTHDIQINAYLFHWTFIPLYLFSYLCFWVWHHYVSQTCTATPQRSVSKTRCREKLLCFPRYPILPPSTFPWWYLPTRSRIDVRDIHTVNLNARIL